MKGLGCILVVLGHCLNTRYRAISTSCKVVFDIVYSFHMPLFFIISGYLFEKYKASYLHSIKATLRKKFKKLIIPYCFFSVLSGVVFAGVLCLNSLNLLNSFKVSRNNISILNLFSGRGLFDIFPHIWFVYVLFIIEAINLAIGNNLFSEIIIGLFSLIGFIFVVPLSIPLIVNRLMLYSLYFIIGKFVFRFELFVKCNSSCKAKAVMVIAFAATFILKMFVSRQDTYLDKCLSNILGIFLGLEGTCCVYLVVNNIKGTLLSVIGKASYNIYLVHHPLISGTVSLLLLKLMTFCPLLAGFISCTITVGASWLVVWIGKLVFKTRTKGVINNV